MADFTLEELMIFCATILGSCGVLIKVIFTSKCKSICWGCCIRDVDAVVASDRLEKTGHTGQTPRLSLDNSSEPAQENP